MAILPPLSEQPIPRVAAPARPLRVLMVAAGSFPLPRGSQVLIAGLSEALQQRGHVVHIVTYPTGARHPLLSVLVERISAPPFCRRMDPVPFFWRPLFDILLARKAANVARRLRVDVLHTHNIEGLLVGLWVRRRLGVPLVYHMHNLMEPELPTYFRFRPGRWAGRRVGHWVDGNLPRRADACIVLDAAVVPSLHLYGLSPEQVHVIPPGVYLPDLAPVSADDVRRRWDLGAGPLVLYSGNLDRYQDLDFLLRAFRQVRLALPEAELVVASHCASAAQHERSLRHSLQQSEHLFCVPTWEEMCYLLVACDVAVAPRQVCWGFPIKVLNYMATGRPIVAARGSAQGLRHMETACVVPNGDEAAFARAILHLLEERELASRLGSAARRRAEECYNWPAGAAAVEHVYRQVSEVSHGRVPDVPL